MAARSSFHHGNLRSALLAAALDLLEKEGLDALSLRVLAERTHVSPAAPYRHFSSKLALLSALAEIANTQLYADYQAAIRDIDPATHLARLSQVYLSFAVRHAQLFRLLFAEDALWAKEGGARPALDLRAYELFEQAVAQRHPQLGVETARQASAACWALLHGFAVLRASGALAGFPVIAAMEATIINLADAVPALIKDGA